MTFNLVDEPWIVIQTAGGSTDTVGLRDLFHNAHRIQRVRGDLATQDFAVLRVVLAIYYRAVLSTAGNDYDMVDVEDLWGGGLPVDAISDYLDQHYARFDLFHPTTPFMQVPDLHLGSGETRGLELIVPDSPGTGKLFTMSQHVDSLTFAEAARWLIHCQAFDFSGIKSGAIGDDRVKSGRGYPIGVGWAGWLGGLIVEGDTLAQTLVHNFAAPKSPDPQDAPLWELAPLTATPRDPLKAGPFGPMSLFTWPIRRLRLFRTGGEVTSVLICNGDPIDYWSQHTAEPMTAWRFSEAQTKKHKSSTPIYMPRAHDPARALWRGLSRMLPAGAGIETTKAGDPASMPSRNLAEVADRVANGLISETHIISTIAVGIEYGPNMSTYGEIFTDSLRFHPSITDPASPSHEAVIAALTRADGAARSLSTFAAELAVASGGDREPAATSSRERAYSELDHAFRLWLRSVENDKAERQLAQWTALAREILTALADEVLAAAPPAARALRERSGHPTSAGTAQNKFRRNLNDHLPYQPPSEGDIHG